MMNNNNTQSEAAAQTKSYDAGVQALTTACSNLNTLGHVARFTPDMTNLAPREDHDSVQRGLQAGGDSNSDNLNLKPRRAVETEAEGGGGPIAAPGSATGAGSTSDSDSDPPSFTQRRHCHSDDAQPQADVLGAGPGPGPSREREQEQEYRLYKARFSGAAGVIALSLVVGLCQPWFGPIANETASTFGITLDQVNWLGNIISVMYLVFAPIVPTLCRRLGLRACYTIGTVFLVTSAWVRYAGTAHSLHPNDAYALLIVSQILSAVPQAAFQVLAPKYSETWFGLKGRTTATMIMSISNPVGTAIGQLISPLVGGVRESILVLGIICTAVSPFVLLIGSNPPTPPSYSGSQPTISTLTTLRAIAGLLPKPSRTNPRAHYDDSGLGKRPPSRSQNQNLGRQLNRSRKEMDEEEGYEMEPSPVSVSSMGKEPESTSVWGIAPGHGSSMGDSQEKKTAGTRSRRLLAILSPNAADMDSDEAPVGAYMTVRERIDFVILAMLFGVLFAGINTFSVLSDQILEPYGYSDDTAGFMGAALLLSGLLAAAILSPLLDRVFTHHLGLAARLLVPPIGAAWLALIWAVRTANTAALYALFVLIGVCSLSVLPVGLELGCELTRNSATSASVLWFCGNLFGIIFVLVMSALRAPSSGDPPLNMHLSLVFSGATIFTLSMSVFAFRGRQRRREMDSDALGIGRR